jgi:hypothetical protein
MKNGLFAMKNGRPQWRTGVRDGKRRSATTFRPSAIVFCLEPTTFQPPAIVFWLEPTTFQPSAIVFWLEPTTFQPSAIVFWLEPTTFQPSAIVFCLEPATFPASATRPAHFVLPCERSATGFIRANPVIRRSTQSYA